MKLRTIQKKLTSQIFFGGVFILSAWVITFSIFPPLQTPDETEHYKYVQALATYHWPRLPKEVEKTTSPDLLNITEAHHLEGVTRNKNETVTLESSYEARKVSDNTQYSSQAYHPPIYYLTTAVFYKISSNFGLYGTTRYYSSRLGSLIFYLATIFFLYKTLMLFFSRKVSFFITLAASIQPTFITLAIGINNEIAAICFATIFFYLFTKSLKNKTFNLKTALLLAVVTSLAILSKFSNIILVPTFVFCLYLYKRKLIDFVQLVTIYLTSTLVLASPWLVTNYLIYNKFIVDNFYLAFTKPEEALNVFNSIKNVSLDYLRAILQIPGFFGWLDTPVPLIIRTIYIIVLVSLAVFGTGLLLRSRHENVFRLKQILLFSFASAFVFFLAFSLNLLINYHLTGLQGRYFLILLAPTVLITTFGVRNLVSNTKKFESLTAKIFYLSVWYFLFCILLIIIPRYYV